MNILPLVSAFILIFSIGTLALLRHCKAALVENKDCHAAYDIQRKIYNEISDEIYQPYKKNKKTEKKKNNPSKNPKQKTNKQYEFPRSKIPPSTYGKLNIITLCRKDKTPNSHLEEIALQLIKNIYEFTCIYENGLEKTILKVLIEIAKANPTVTIFEDLYMYIPKEHAELFYKIFNGTQSYKIHTSKGYPPLRDFLIISEAKDHKPIQFIKASEPLLIAAFDEAIARKIICAEEQQWRIDPQKKLKKEDFENLLLQEGINLASFGDGLFYFSTSGKNENPEKIYIDKKSNKAIRWKQK